MPHDLAFFHEPHIRRTGTVVLVTYCKGRRFQLEQMLPLAMKQVLPPGYCLGGVVVVDFGCPDDTVGWVVTHVETLRSPHQVVCVAGVRDNTEFFQICRARNVGLCEAFGRLGADFAFLMDCDILMHDPDCMATYIRKFEEITDDDHRSGVVGTATRVWDEVKQEEVEGMISACLIHRDAFTRLRGYDESHTGYGHDDTNFFKRAKLSGLSFGLTPLNYEHLFYEEELRDQYLTAPRSREEIERTARWCDDLERPVNPAGYGQYRGFFIKKEPR